MIGIGIVIKLAAYIGGTILIYYIKRRCGGPYCQCTTNLNNKAVLVTGATSGIGYSVVEQLALRGAHVIFTARDLTKGIQIQNKLREKTKNQSITCEQLDLEDLKSVQTFASGFHKQIHVLIINAGIFYHPPQETADGFDITFQTNYLGHFLLTELLLTHLQRDSRIIFTSSAGHSYPKFLDLESLHTNEKVDSSITRFHKYGESKLCLLLYSKHLAERLKDRRIHVYSVDPGSVETPIYRHFPFIWNSFLWAIQKPIRFIIIRTPLQGAQTILHCALSSKLGDDTGLFYWNLKPVPSSTLSNNTELAAQLYDRSLVWSGLVNQGNPVINDGALVD